MYIFTFILYIIYICVCWNNPWFREDLPHLVFTSEDTATTLNLVRSGLVRQSHFGIVSDQKHGCRYVEMLLSIKIFYMYIYIYMYIHAIDI